MATIHRAAAVVLRDVRGYTATVRWTQAFDDSALAAAMALAVDLSVAIVSMSNGVVNSTSGLASEGVEPGAPGNNAVWPSIADKAVMTWRATNGQLLRQRIPAPVASIFLPDGVTVDPANGLVTAYVAAVLAASVTTRGAVFLSDLVAGHLEQHRVRRRIGTTILEPGLTSSDY